MTDPSSPLSPTDPPLVSRHDELLSAMIDGEVTREELAILEELAVSEGTTLGVLAGDLQLVRDEVAASVIDLRAPSGLRDHQLIAAIEAADPGIASLAAARAGRQRRESLARRIPLLSGVAAALLVVAGLGMAGVLSGGGSEDAATAGEAGEGGATLSRQLDAATTTAPAAEQLESSAEASEDSAAGDEAAAAAELFGVAAPEPVVVEGIAPGDLGAVVAYRDITPASQDEFNRDLSYEEEVLACAPGAAQLGEVNGVAVVDVDGEVYEVYRTVEGATAVFRSLDCARVD